MDEGLSDSSGQLCQPGRVPRLRLPYLARVFPAPPPTHAHVPHTGLRRPTSHISEPRPPQAEGPRGHREAGPEMPAAILPAGCSKMGLGLPGALLLFLGSSLIYSNHDALSERSRRGSSWEQTRHPRWPEAVSRRPRPQKVQQGQEEGELDTEGSICSFFSLDRLPCLSPTSVVFELGALLFCFSNCL